MDPFFLAIMGGVALISFIVGYKTSNGVRRFSEWKSNRKLLKEKAKADKAKKAAKEMK